MAIERAISSVCEALQLSLQTDLVTTNFCLGGLASVAASNSTKIHKHIIMHIIFNTLLSEHICNALHVDARVHLSIKTVQPTTSSEPRA